MLQIEEKLKSIQQSKDLAEHKLSAEAESRITAQENLRIYADRIAELEKQQSLTAAAKIDTQQKLAAEAEAKQQTQNRVNSLMAEISHLEQMLRQESAARNELEQKLVEKDAHIETAQTSVTEIKDQAQKQIDSLTAQLARLENTLQEETNAKIAAQQKLAEETQARLKAEQKAQLEAERAAQAEESEDRRQKTEERGQDALDTTEDGSSVLSPQSSVIRLICDCCGQNTFTLDQLVKIDSGHLFCPDCLAALRR